MDENNTQNSTPSKTERLKEIGFKQGHPKYGGIQKGQKHLKTLIEAGLKRKTIVAETGKKVSADTLIIDKLIELGTQGNLKAIEMIIDRIDGKVRNEIKAEITETPIAQMLREIREENKDPLVKTPNIELNDTNRESEI